MQLTAPPLAYAARRAHARGSTPSSGGFVGALARPFPTRPSAGATASSRTASPSSCPAGSSRASTGSPGSRRVYAGSIYQVLAGPDADTIHAHDLAAAPLPDRRGRHQDRDHRRRGRPDPSVLRPRRLHDACRASRRGSRVHHAQRSSSHAPFRRRARHGGTPAGRSTPRNRGTRRMSPASRPATRTRSAGRVAGQRDRATRVHRELQGADRPHRRERRPRRQRAGARRGDRGRRPGRDGRDQPLDRRARDRRRSTTSSRSRSTRPRRPGSCPSSPPGTTSRSSAQGRSRSPGSRCRRDHGRRIDVGRVPVDRGLLLLRPDADLPEAEARRRRAGHAILSSQPGRLGHARRGRAWRRRTSPAAVALLLQRHPDWSPAEVKAALTVTARPVGPATSRRRSDTRRRRARRRRRAPTPRSSARRRPRSRSGSCGPAVSAHAGGAARRRGRRRGRLDCHVRACPGPGRDDASPCPRRWSSLARSPLDLTAGAREGELAGAVVLRRNGVARRIPVWGRVAAPQLAAAQAPVLQRPGHYAGNTRGRAARRRHLPLSRGAGRGHRHEPAPRDQSRCSASCCARPVANFGVVITSRAPGVRVEPRFVADGDENRLTGYAALPFDLNPYVDEFEDPVLAAGAIMPAPGTYAVVFDSASRAGRGHVQVPVLGRRHDPADRATRRADRRCRRVRSGFA